MSLFLLQEATTTLTPQTSHRQTFIPIKRQKLSLNILFKFISRNFVRNSFLSSKTIFLLMIIVLSFILNVYWLVIMILQKSVDTESWSFPVFVMLFFKLLYTLIKSVFFNAFSSSSVFIKKKKLLSFFSYFDFFPLCYAGYF